MSPYRVHWFHNSRHSIFSWGLALFLGGGDIRCVRLRLGGYSTIWIVSSARRCATTPPPERTLNSAHESGDQGSDRRGADHVMRRARSAANELHHLTDFGGGVGGWRCGPAATPYRGLGPDPSGFCVGREIFETEPSYGETANSLSGLQLGSKGS